MSRVEAASLDATQVNATRTRILDAAEQLFAEHGVAATTIRQITDLATVNVAAVNYHFEGKENLVRQVIARRIETLEQARAAALDEAEARAKAQGRVPSAAELVDAWIAPVFALALSEERGWSNFIRFISRIAWEPRFEDLVPPESSLALFQRFILALRRAIPSFPADGRALWRLNHMRGAYQNALLILLALRSGQIPANLPLAADARSVGEEEIRRQLVAFLTAGLSAE